MFEKGLHRVCKSLVRALGRGHRKRGEGRDRASSGEPERAVLPPSPPPPPPLGQELTAPLQEATARNASHRVRRRGACGREVQMPPQWALTFHTQNFRQKTADGGVR